MKSKHKHKKVDSLIITMIPMQPRYDASATHQGVMGAEDTSLDNMMEEDRDLLDMAKKDITLLQAKRRKKQLPQENFGNAVIYPHVIYAGRLEGENSLSHAMTFMATNHKCRPEELKILTINITAHGNPETVGTKKSISFSPDNEMSGLATVIYGYLEQSISKTTKLSFYLLSCNSGYVSYSEAEEEGGVKDEERVKRKILKRSFAGRFFQGVKKEIGEQESGAIQVSGFRGFLAHDQGRLVATRKEAQQPRAGELADMDYVRFVIGDSDSAESDIEVTLPRGYKFKVENVKRSLTAEETIDIRVMPEVKSAAAAAEMLSADNVISEVEVALRIASQERTLIEIVRHRKEEQSRIEQAPRREIFDRIFPELRRDYPNHMEFLIKRKDWFEFFIDNPDSREDVLNFLQSKNLWHFEALDMYFEEKIPKEETLLVNIRQYSSDCFKDLSNMFTKCSMELMYHEEISFNELLKIYLNDSEAFEVLQSGIDGLFGGNPYTLKNVIKYYQEQKKIDPNLDLDSIIDAAAKHEYGEHSELPFPILSSDDEEEKSPSTILAPGSSDNLKSASTEAVVADFKNI